MDYDPADYTLHQFRPTETIDAVMRLFGRHNYTPQELADLRVHFNQLNGKVVPRVGDVFKIPLESLVGKFAPNGEPTDMVDVPVVSSPRDNGQEPANCESAGNPGEPVNEAPASVPGEHNPEQAAQDNRDEQVPPNLGEQPSQALNSPVVTATQGSQGTLSVIGSRRRRANNHLST